MIRFKKRERQQPQQPSPDEQFANRCRADTSWFSYTTSVTGDGRVRYPYGKGWYVVRAMCTECGAFIAADYIDEHYAALHPVPQGTPGKLGMTHDQ